MTELWADQYFKIFEKHTVERCDKNLVRLSSNSYFVILLKNENFQTGLNLGA